MLRRLWQRLLEALLRERRERQAELARVEEPELLQAEWRARRQRLVLWLASAALGAGLLGMAVGQLVREQTHPDIWSAEARRPVIVDVTTQSDRKRFALQLTLDRSLFYERYRPEGALSLRLPRARLATGDREGRIARPGGSFSWSVRQEGGDVRILLVGVGAVLAATDQLDENGDTWVLSVLVPLPAVDMPRK